MFNAGEIYSKLQAVLRPESWSRLKGQDSLPEPLPSGPSFYEAYFPNKTCSLHYCS